MVKAKNPSLADFTQTLSNYKSSIFYKIIFIVYAYSSLTFHSHEKLNYASLNIRYRHTLTLMFWTHSLTNVCRMQASLHDNVNLKCYIAKLNLSKFGVTVINISDDYFMGKALELAKKGEGFTNPNPMVGAIVVKGNKIIGSGYHQKFGGEHAEVIAIDSCNANGATLYVTLEPCCHKGKTPPCTDKIIKSGIKKVVVGVRDPNPLVSGRGINTLKNNGIQIVENILNDKCKEINNVFFHYITTGLPYVVMKYAMTIDGKIATRTGASKYISGEESLNYVHKLRHKYSGIMVGINTVLADNPQLTCRIPGLTNPCRIICDTNLRTPLNLQIIETAKNIPTIIATASTNEHEWYKYLVNGVQIVNVSRKDNVLDIKDLMKKLGALGIDSILLEGGSGLNWSAISSGVVNKVMASVSPKIFGGEKAITPIAGVGVDLPQNGYILTNLKINRFGNDFLIEGDLCLQE